MQDVGSQVWEAACEVIDIKSASDLEQCHMLPHAHAATCHHMLPHAATLGWDGMGSVLYFASHSFIAVPMSHTPLSFHPVGFYNPFTSPLPGCTLTPSLPSPAGGVPPHMAPYAEPELLGNITPDQAIMKDFFKNDLHGTKRPTIPSYFLSHEVSLSEMLLPSPLPHTNTVVTTITATPYWAWEEKERRMEGEGRGGGGEGEGRGWEGGGGGGGGGGGEGRKRRGGLGPALDETLDSSASHSLPLLPQKYSIFISTMKATWTADARVRLGAATVLKRLEPVDDSGNGSSMVRGEGGREKREGGGGGGEGEGGGGGGGGGGEGGMGGRLID